MVIYQLNSNGASGPALLDSPVPIQIMKLSNIGLDSPGIDCLGTPDTGGMGLDVHAAWRRLDSVESAFHWWLYMTVVGLR